MYKIVFLRHGESLWNKENRFTGWTDIDLSENGIVQAQEAAQLLKKEGFGFDIVFTSVLKRSIRTLWIVLDKMDMMWIPVRNSWRLNERHYGALQGLNKTEMVKKYGEEQVFAWRRGFDVRPPELASEDLSHPANDSRYADVLREDLPSAESLCDTCKRCMPYWLSDIVPAVKAGKKVLISAHGNSLRAIIKYLDEISDQDISNIDIPTGVPLVYELDENLKPIKHYYLGDQAEIERRIEQVKNQGKAK
jgi:2,3-bisphosphoglycerate-dependent phosphoglycerate mutase